MMSGRNAVDPLSGTVEAPVNSAGVSAQAVYHVGVPVGTSIDFRLYRNDPEVYQRFFAPEQYPGGLSYTVSLEGSYLVQTLSDPDVFGRTVPQEARAVALYDDVALLQSWLREDILSVAGPDHASRVALYDFVVERGSRWGSTAVGAGFPACPANSGRLESLPPLLWYLHNSRFEPGPGELHEPSVSC